MPYPEDSIVVIRGNGSILVACHDGTALGRRRLARSIEELVKTGAIKDTERSIITSKLYGVPDPSRSEKGGGL